LQFFYFFISASRYIRFQELIISLLDMSTPAAKPAAPKQAKAPKAKGAPKEKKEKTERRLGVTVKDVAADQFIAEYASYLKKAGKLRTPKWVDYVKTGITRELGPLDPDWLYVRAGTCYENYCVFNFTAGFCFA
jgi:hypothetical protein